MRALFRNIVVALGLLMMVSFGDVLLSSRLFLDAPRIHTVQDGEYFSQLAKDYYGSADYWRALALVNRAPDKDLIFPGERVILPSAGAIAEIAGSRSLSRVNEIVEKQQRLAAIEVQEEAAEFTSRMVPLTEAPEEEATTESEEAVAPVIENPAVAEVEGLEPELPALEGETGFMETAVEGDGINVWYWIPGIMIGFFVFGTGYIYYKKRQDEPMDSKTSKEDEQKEINMDSRMHDTTPKFIDPMTDQLFKPVQTTKKGKRQLKKKEADMTLS